MSEIAKIQKALFADLKKATIAIMKQRGIKANANLLDLDWQQTKPDVITLIANDYFEFVDKGRVPGTMPPPQDLILWMKKSGISPKPGMSLNQLAFVIANAIKKNGIKGKFYSQAIEEASTDIVSEELATQISEKTCDELVQAIENN